MLIGIIETCSDYGLANLLVIVQKIMNLFQILVPIIAIVALIKILIKLVSDPENKKLKNSIKNWAIALIFIFFLPMVVDLTMNLITTSQSNHSNGDENFSISACWESAKKNTTTSVNGHKYIDAQERKKIIHYDD